MIDKLYYKNEKGRYIPYGIYDPNGRNIPNGVWLIQSDNSSSSLKSMIHKVGNLEKPDINIHAFFQQHDGEVARYLTKLQDPCSEELKEAKEQLGGYLTSEVKVYNISMGDLATLVLKKLGELCQEEVGKNK